MRRHFHFHLYFFVLFFVFIYISWFHFLFLFVPTLCYAPIKRYRIVYFQRSRSIKAFWQYWPVCQLLLLRTEWQQKLQHVKRYCRNMHCILIYGRSCGWVVAIHGWRWGEYVHALRWALRQIASGGIYTCKNETNKKKQHINSK